MKKWKAVYSLCMLCLLMLAGGLWGKKDAQAIFSNEIGTTYSKTEGGKAYPGVCILIEDQMKTYAYDDYTYHADTGWTLNASYMDGETYSQEKDIAFGQYMRNVNLGRSRRFNIRGEHLNFYVPKVYSIETIRYQYGKEISREYEYSIEPISSCISTEYSLMAALLKDSHVIYGPIDQEDVSVEYRIKAGKQLKAGGDFRMVADGATIQGVGYAFCDSWKYLVYSLPTAVKKSDKYEYTFRGWYTEPEGGTKINVGDALKGSQVLYAQFDKKIASYPVKCIDILGEDVNGVVLGESELQAGYEQVVSGADAGDVTVPGEYYPGRVYAGCTKETITSHGMVVYRFFKSAMISVFGEDIVRNGPDAGTRLGTNTWNAAYASTVSGGAMGTDSTAGAYYKGYRYVSSTSNQVGSTGCTIYRYFEPVTYNIRFVSETASGSSMSVMEDCYYGHTYQLTQNVYIKKSKVSLDLNGANATAGTSSLWVYHDFIGWADAPGEGVKYSDGCNVRNLCEQPDVKTLYAVWSDKEVNVTVKPERMGYEFAGWARTPDAKNGETQFQIDGDTTLYALWKPAPSSYHIEYYKQKADRSFELSMSYTLSEYTEKVVETEDIADIYPGFWLDKDASNLKGTVKADGSLVLTAYFRRGEYSVDFDLNGGSVQTDAPKMERIKGLFEEEVVIPQPTIERKGYLFAGWGVTPDAVQSIVRPGETLRLPNHDQILYAVWLPRDDTTFRLIPYYKNMEQGGYIQGSDIALKGRTDAYIGEAICSLYDLSLSECITKLLGGGYKPVEYSQLLQQRIHGDGTSVAAVYLEPCTYQIQYRKKSVTESESPETSVAKESAIYSRVYTLPFYLKDFGNVGRYVDASEQVYYPGEKLNPVSDMVLYPQYSVSLHYLCDNKQDEAVYLYLDQSCYISVPQKKGYTFLGWYFDSGYNKLASLKAYRQEKVNESITLYAKWSPVPSTGQEPEWTPQQTDSPRESVPPELIPGTALPVSSSAVRSSFEPGVAATPTGSALTSSTGSPAGEDTKQPQPSQQPMVSQIPQPTEGEQEETPQVSGTPVSDILPTSDIPQGTTTPVVSDIPQESTTPSPLITQDPVITSIPQSSVTPDRNMTAAPEPTTTPTQLPGNGQVSIMSTWIGASPDPGEIAQTLSRGENALVKKGSRIARKGIVYQVTATKAKKRTVKVYSCQAGKKKVTIPDSVLIRGKKYKVTGIREKAFTKCKKLEKVVLGIHIKKVGKKVFCKNKKLKTVIIQSNKGLKQASKIAGSIPERCKIRYKLRQ